MVVLLVLSHVASALAAELEKEVRMELTNISQNNGHFKKPLCNVFLSSCSTTMWAIGTSVVASALSA
jgi:hypothetical protein